MHIPEPDEFEQRFEAPEPDLAGPAAAEILKELKAKFPSATESYLDFIARHNGADCELPLMPYWLVLFTAEEMVNDYDAYKEFLTELPNCITIGTNGGGELVVLDTENNGRICCLPFINEGQADLMQVAVDFKALEAMLGQPQNLNFADINLDLDSF
jgi:hypothetical protein